MMESSASKPGQSHPQIARIYEKLDRLSEINKGTEQKLQEAFAIAKNIAAKLKIPIQTAPKQPEIRVLLLASNQQQSLKQVGEGMRSSQALIKNALSPPSIKLLEEFELSAKERNLIDQKLLSQLEYFDSSTDPNLETEDIFMAFSAGFFDYAKRHNREILLEIKRFVMHDQTAERILAMPAIQAIQKQSKSQFDSKKIQGLYVFFLSQLSQKAWREFTSTYEAIPVIVSSILKQYFLSHISQKESKRWEGELFQSAFISQTDAIFQAIGKVFNVTPHFVKVVPSEVSRTDCDLMEQEQDYQLVRPKVQFLGKDQQILFQIETLENSYLPVMFEEEQIDTS